MAKVYPSLDVIKNFKLKPTPGEWKILTFLNDNLSDEYEIYFQPYLNGDRPDLIIFRENSGFMVIEVKDWQLSSYRINEDGDWCLRSNGQVIKSPINQVDKYKNNLLTLHIEDLYFDFLRKAKTWSVGNSCIFFSNAREEEINEFTEKIFKVDDKQKKQSVKFLQTLGSDSLKKNTIDEVLESTRLNKRGFLFKPNHAESLRRILRPPVHDIEDGLDINYTSAQKDLIGSEINQRRKIKGVAGCGKTFVLAKRAVNAFLRTNETVLILTYNITLKNYIHDKISQVRENFPWDKFHIVNYHQWFIAEANNNGLETSLKSFDVEDFFKYANISYKYKTILIDEVQDFKQAWLINVINYFLDKNGELIVFGDEKQNIYKNATLDNEKTPTIPSIPGAWNRSLTTSMRFGPEVLNLTKSFQKEFLSKKYNVDNVTVDQQQLALDEVDIKYLYFEENLEFAKNIDAIIKRFSINDSDVCIQSPNVESLREIEQTLRKKYGRNKIKKTFETEEEHDLILFNCNLTKAELKNTFEKDLDEPALSNFKIKKRRYELALDQARRNRKLHFWMKTGTLKMATIHSFKGWDIPTTFLIIPSNIEEKDIELIYTGLTRTRYRLYVIAQIDNYFHEFFIKNIEQSFLFNSDN